MTAREMFLQQVKSILAPELRRDGFRKSRMNFRRILGPVVHVLTIQGSAYGGQCCVNLGIYLDFLSEPGTDGPCDPKTISEWACEFRTRLTPTGADHWWPYGESEAEAAAAVTSILELYRERGAPYFGRFASFPADFTRVTPDTPEQEYGALLPPIWTEARRDPALARIYHRLGDAHAVRFFATRGMAAAGPSGSFGKAFRGLLSGG